MSIDTQSRAALGELIALLKREPGRHTYASSGAGTIVHLSAHMLAQMAGAEAVHVPYRGSGPAMNDLIAGTVDFMVDTLPTVIPFVRSGQLRALAVTTRERSAALPEVPTAAEAGLPDYETYNWHGVFAATNGIELPLLYGVGATALALTGPGAYSLDAWLGLTGLWTVEFALAAVIAGIVAALVNLALRRTAPETAAA